MWLLWKGAQLISVGIQAIYTWMGIIKSIPGMRITIESDSLIVVNLLNSPKNLSHLLAPLVEDCKALLRETEATSSTMCEGNKVANAFAKLGAETAEELKIFKEPIQEVEELLLRGLLIM